MRSAHKMGWILRSLPVLFAAILVLTACGKKDQTVSPRERVLQFVKEVQRDTLPDISSYIDIDSIATYLYSAKPYDTLTLAQKKDQLVRDFTGRGAYIRTWSQAQIVVNNQSFVDDTTATVQVSFIDRKTRVQYLTEMRLKRRNGWWYITDFKANEPH